MRKLSSEELATELHITADRAPHATAHIRAHIAALEAELARFAADAQLLSAVRAHRWKCHCGRPVNLAAIIDAVKENPE